jgi:hypothetical protein
VQPKEANNTMEIDNDEQEAGHVNEMEQQMEESENQMAGNAYLCDICIY